VTLHELGAYAAQPHAPQSLTEQVLQLHVLAPLSASAGQAADDPVQLSALSHGPAAARHTVDAGEKELAGQEPDEPVQVSAGSQTPPEARQVVPPALKVQLEVQHDPAVPFVALP
jgi:hypothetical protein